VTKLEGADCVDVPDVAELATTDGDVVLLIDEIVVTRDPGAAVT